MADKHHWNGYTDEQLTFIRDNQHLRRFEIVDLFNAKFSDRIMTLKGLNSLCHRHKIKCLNNGRKGILENLKGDYINPNTKEVGYERINKNGFIEVRCAEKTGNGYFRCKHILLWEQHHKQKLPRNHSIVFLDGNSRNFDISNLLLMPIAAVLQRSINTDYDSAPPELKPSINLLSKLKHQLVKAQK